MNYIEDDFTDYYYERMDHLVATETEFQATIKRLEGMIQAQQQQMGGMKQGYISVGNLSYNVVNELMLALGDPTDEGLRERAKRHGREWLKHWDETLEAIRKADEQRIVELPKPTLVALDGAPLDGKPIA